MSKTQSLQSMSKSQRKSVKLMPGLLHAPTFVGHSICGCRLCVCIAAVNADGVVTVKVVSVDVMHELSKDKLRF